MIKAHFFKRLYLPFIIMAFFMPISWFLHYPLKLDHVPLWIDKIVNKAAPGCHFTAKNAYVMWDRDSFKPQLLLENISIKQDGFEQINLEKGAFSIDLAGIFLSSQKPLLEVYLDNLKFSNKSSTSGDLMPITNCDLSCMLANTDKLKNLPLVSFILRNSTIDYNGEQFSFHKIKVITGKEIKLQLWQNPKEKLLDSTIEISNKNAVLINGKVQDLSYFSVAALYSLDQLNIAASLSEMPSSNLLALWPQQLETSVTTWLKKNLTEGQVECPELKIKFSKIAGSSYFKLEDILAEIKVTDGILSYMEDGGPSIRNLSANIAIHNEIISITSDHATLNDTPIEYIKADITKVGSDDAILLLVAKISASVAKTIEIAVAHSPGYHHRFGEVEGWVQNEIKVTIPFSKPEDQLIEVDSILTEVQIKNVYDGYSINDGSLAAHYKNDKFYIEGKAKINNIFDAMIKYYPLSEDGVDSEKIEIDTIITPAILKDIGFTPPSFFKNKARIKFTVNDSKYGAKKFIEIIVDNNLDFKDSKLAALKLNSIKGLFKSEIVQEYDHSVILKEYALNIGEFSSHGDMKLNPDYSLATLISNKTKLDDGIFSFEYHSDNSGEYINIKGNKLDLRNISPYTLGQKSSNKGGKPFNLVTSLNKIIMYNGLELDKPELTASCSPTLCTSAKLKGIFSDGSNININYNYPDLSFYSNNAGNSLRALNIYQNMKGGLLAATAKFTSNGEAGIAKGNIDIENYYLIKTPILSRLLSITAASSISFGGIADLIQGNGVHFSKLKCPILYANKIITLEDCYQDGNVMAMTANGELDLKANTINVNGILSPVNLINTISRNIPLLSQLSGGRKNGLIAMNYNIKGPLSKDAKIYVNPLSVLAPGFLKGIGKPKS